MCLSVLLTKLSKYITLAQGHVSRPSKVLSFKCINCNFGNRENITPSSIFVFLPFSSNRKRRAPYRRLFPVSLCSCVCELLIQAFFKQMTLDLSFEAFSEVVSKQTSLGYQISGYPCIYFFKGSKCPSCPVWLICFENMASQAYSLKQDHAYVFISCYMWFLREISGVDFILNCVSDYWFEKTRCKVNNLLANKFTKPGIWHVRLYTSKELS